MTRRTVRHRNFSVEDFREARHTDPEVVIAMGNRPERLHRSHMDTLTFIDEENYRTMRVDVNITRNASFRSGAIQLFFVAR